MRIQLFFRPVIVLPKLLQWYINEDVKGDQVFGNKYGVLNQFLLAVIILPSKVAGNFLPQKLQGYYKCSIGGDVVMTCVPFVFLRDYLIWLIDMYSHVRF
jgi:hypothetical protein